MWKVKIALTMLQKDDETSRQCGERRYNFQLDIPTLKSIKSFVSLCKQVQLILFKLYGLKNE